MYKKSMYPPNVIYKGVFIIFYAIIYIIISPGGGAHKTKVVN